MFRYLSRLSTVLLAYYFLAPAAQAQDAAKAPEAKKEAVDEKTIRGLITQLGDDSFDNREEAQKRLAAIGMPALDLLRKAAKDGADLETRQRATQLVQEIGQGLFVAKINDKDWGNSVDPDGDCKFRLELGKLHIKVPGTPHRLGIEVRATNAPRLLRQIEGDFHAEVQVQGTFPAAKKSLVGKYPWFGAGLLVWQDDKNYIRLERANLIFNPGNAQCYANWELRLSGKHEVKGGGHDGILDESIPAFFKLDRKGDIFTAAHSQDGKEWKELPPIEAPFGKKVGVGVTASQNTAAGYEGVFEGLKITQAPKP
jgi:regulation of enolase protein 1 (concanavalin A-like superfamily)